MSNIKKIIGVVLALVMVLSVATIAFAADGDAYSVAFTADKTTLDAGESATVTVKITSNFNVSAMSIPVFFDNSKVTVTAATTLPADKTKIATEADPDVDKYFQGSGHTKDDYGIRALVYVAKQGDSIRSYSDEAVMTLTVTAKDGASGAVVLECISTTVKTSANPSGTLYLAKNASGSAEVDSLGEVIDNATVTGAKATITIAGAAGNPQIIAKEGSTGHAATKDGVNYLYGVQPGTNEAGLADYFEAVDGKLVWNSTGTVGGTGTVCELQTNDSTVVATYILIIFGDVDGDGIITVTDSGNVEKAAAFDSTAVTGYGVISANVDGDDAITVTDSGNVEKAAAFDLTAINQEIGIAGATLIF